LPQVMPGSLLPAQFLVIDQATILFKSRIRSKRVPCMGH
jgi:hypothetical protein